MSGEELSDGGEVRTAVKGVDPGEPGQAASTEGLHPLFLSLSQLLSLFLMSSVLLCSCFLRCLASFLLSLKHSLHLAWRSKKNHSGKNVRRHPGVQQADKQES